MFFYPRRGFDLDGGWQRSLLARLIHAHERRHVRRDVRQMYPFDWGASFITDHTNGDEPRRIFARHTQEVMRRSDDFFALHLPVVDYTLAGDDLTWTSAVHTPSPENNTARARFFPAISRATRQTTRAVVVLPQWNADATSHVALCRLLNRFRISALRLTLPYHEARRPPELARADYLISPNIGRTIQSVRQAVLDARAAVSWLVEHRGFESVGIVGTSIGSCAAFLTFAHDERLRAGVFNHVSSYFADVVWRGVSTAHIRASFGDHLTLDELREYWLPISPFPFAQKLQRMRMRPMRFICARHDLSFPADLSRDAITEARRLGLPLDVTWIPCGHYSLGNNPWKYLDGWKIISFLRKHL